jgi:putative thiamine transport system permease protein
VLRLAPPLTILIFLGPVAAGLLGTALPAFGWLPAIGADEPGLEPWRRLLAMPGLGHALAITLGSGLVSTALAFTAAATIAAATHDTALRRPLALLVPVLLAVPHLASAIGFAFLAAPSGWPARLVSPWLTGWQRPPDLLTLNDPWGVTLTLGLAVREAPFLLFAILAAMGQVDTARQLRVARSLGYGTAEAWAKLVLPQLFPLLRLPLCAVLAFALSVVDVAIVLGPSTPAPLAVELVRLAADPDLAVRLPAAAGALLLLLLTVAVAAAVHGGQLLLARWTHPWLACGPSRRRDRALRLTGLLATAIVGGLGLASLASLVLWSVAGPWRFPATLPDAFTLESWRWAAHGLHSPLATSLALGLASAALALALTLACLEHESRTPPRSTARVIWLVYLPLLIPQLSFLFGLQVVLITAGLDGTWPALVWTHLVFVLPYVFLMLRGPYLALDPHYSSAARVLGRTEAWVFWRVKLPLLRRPVAVAAAVGITVSLALYLPTLFAGGGRFATLTTETLALAGSADRRLAATAGLVLALTPLVALGVAGAVRPPAAVRARSAAARLRAAGA